MAVALQPSNSFSGGGNLGHLGGKKLDLEMIYEEEDDMIDDSSGCGGQSDQGGLQDFSILEFFNPELFNEFFQPHFHAKIFSVSLLRILMYSFSK